MIRLVALLVVVANAPEMIPPDEGDVVGRTAPDVELKLPEGKTAKLGAYRGKPLIISFWASWCAPCRKELPALAKLAHQRPDLAFLAINVDKDRQAADKVVSDLKLDLPLAFDSDSLVMSKFDVVIMPTMFVLDKEGTVKLKKIGYSPDNAFADVLAALDKK